MFFVTAKIIIFLPYKTTVKEGDLYETIEKPLVNEGKVIIYPFEYLGTITNLESGNYVEIFRKIRIDVTLPIQSNKVDFSKREQQRPFLDIANKFLNLFLRHCRTKSKQFWWHSIYLNDSNMSRIRYEIQFIADDTAKILYEVKVNTGGLGPVGVGINKQIWDKIKSDFVSDIEPNIVDFYMEEARTALFSKSIDLLIINIAIALEIFTSRFCLEYAQKIGKGNDICFKSLLESNDSFVIKNFKKTIPHLTTKDFSTEEKAKYDLIDFLFRTRNKIVHDGEVYYKDDNGTKHIVDYKKAHQFFLTAIDLLEWIRKIDTNIAEQLKCFIDTN